MTAPQPFVKWVGGKRQLLPSILPLLPQRIRHYREPFLGGGAVFFALAHEERFEHAVISDLNKELVACYRAIATQLPELCDLLDSMPITKEHFLTLRESTPMTDVTIAARLIFLNKTCFNGLYRVNQSGRFNVPWGKHKNPRLYDRENLAACSRALQSATIVHSDFQLFSVQPGDAVYFDPPYFPVSPTANFKNYTKDGFGFRDQQRLANLARQLRHDGAHVLLSNADLPIVRDLYDGFTFYPVQARRSINCDASKRGGVGELLILGEPQ